MFGLKLYQQQYVTRLESELEYYRLRSDEERRRADRLQDQLLVMSGQLPVTEVVRNEERDLHERIKDAVAQQAQDLNEMFGEELGELEKYDGLELPPDLKDEAAAMIEGPK